MTGTMALEIANARSKRMQGPGAQTMAMEAPVSGSRTPGRADRARHDNQLKAVNQWTGTHPQ
jgi:hypothetical protein